MPASPRAVVWNLSFAMGLMSVGQSMLSTAVPLLAVALGLAPTWVGILVALPNLLPVAFGMRAGSWIDRGDAGRWLAGGVAGMATAPLLLVLAPQAVVLALAQLLLGAFQTITGLSSQSYVADASPSGGLERAYANHATFLSAGRLVGPIGVGILIDAAGFRLAFAAASVASLAALIVVGRLRANAPVGSALGHAHARNSSDDPASSHAADRDVDPPTPASVERPFGVREAWRNVGVQVAVLASSAVFVAVSVRQAFLPVVLDDIGFRATEIGVLLSLGGAASLIMRPLMPVVSRILGGPARTLAVALALLTVGVGLLGFVSTFAAFAALSLMAGAATGFGSPLSIVTVAQHVGPRERGTALGLRMASNRGAQLVAPIAVGALIGAAGFAFGFGAVGLLLAVVAMLVTLRVPAYEGTSADRARVRDRAS